MSKNSVVKTLVGAQVSREGFRMTRVYKISFVVIAVTILVMAAGYWVLYAWRTTPVLEDVDPALVPKKLSELERREIAAPLAPASNSQPASDSVGPCTVLGRVFMPDGAPAAGATIEIREVTSSALSREAFATYTCGDDGRFRATGLHEMTMVIRASKDGLAALDVRRIRKPGPGSVIRLTLHATYTISGSVLNSDGAPIGGARVYPYKHERYELYGPDGDALATRSEKDGAFTLHDLEGGPWVIAADALGYSTGLSEPTVAGSSDCVIALGNGAHLGGKLLDLTTGVGVPNQVIECRCLSKGVGMATAISGDAGEFSLDNLFPGKHLLTLRSEEYALEGNVKITLDDMASVDDFVLHAVPAASISGHVYRAGGKVGVPSANVSAQESELSVDEYKGTTDKDGEYTISGLRPGDYNVRSWIHPFPSTKITVGPGAHVTGVDFIAPSNHEITGIVLDSKNDPVKGADVTVFVRADSSIPPGANMRLTHGSRMEPWTQTVTDDAGMFRFEVNTYVHTAGLKAVHASGSSPLIGPFEVPPNGAQGIVLRLELPADAQLAGIVVDKKGFPAHAILKFQDLDKATSPFNVTTDTEGQFALTVASPARYEIQIGPFARPHFYFAFPTKAPVLSVGPGEIRKNLRFVLDDSGRTSIDGIVVDASGAPVMNVSVSANLPQEDWRPGEPAGRGAGWATDRDGYFNIDDLTGRAYDLCVQRRGSNCNTVMENVAPGTHNLVLVANSGLSVSGRVVAAKSGKPIDRFELSLGVRVPGSNYANRYVPRQSFADPDGRFMYTIDPFPPASDETVLVAAVPGNNTAWVAIPRKATEAGGLVIAIEMDENTAVEGTVRDDMGAAVGGAQIFLDYLPRSDQDATKVVATTDASGAFRAEGVGTSVSEVWAVHPEFGPASTQIEIVEGQTSQADIVLQRAGIVEGIVRDSGLPVANAQVMLSPRSLESNITTDETGQYRFSHVSVGEVTVRAQYPKSDLELPTIVLAKPCVIEARQTTVVDFDYPSDMPEKK
jgi:hypothetical protein